MTQETELLPCPFCGSENILEFGKQDDDWASVECRNCRAGTHKFENLQDAVAAWNSRASLGKVEAKPVEVGELAAIISDAVHDNPFAILSEKSPLTAEQERKRASAILSRYNVTKKEEV